MSTTTDLRVEPTEPVPYVLTDAGLGVVAEVVEVPGVDYDAEPQPSCETCLDASVVLAREGRDQIHVTCPDCGTPDTAPAATSTPAVGAVRTATLPQHQRADGAWCRFSGCSSRSGFCPAGCVLPELQEVPC